MTGTIIRFPYVCLIQSTVASPSTRSRPKRTIRQCVQIDEGLEDEGCSANHCEDPYRVGDLVKCMGVGCGLQVSKDRVTAHLYTFSMQFHLTCVLERPVEGEVWFCDDECHMKSGFHSKKHRVA